MNDSDIEDRPDLNAGKEWPEMEQSGELAWRIEETAANARPE